jgi:hypothetical protein
VYRFLASGSSRLKRIVLTPASLSARRRMEVWSSTRRVLPTGRQPGCLASCLRATPSAVPTQLGSREPLACAVPHEITHIWELVRCDVCSVVARAPTCRISIVRVFMELAKISVHRCEGELPDVLGQQMANPHQPVRHSCWRPKDSESVRRRLVAPVCSCHFHNACRHRELGR